MDPFSKCEENTCFLTKVSHFIVAHRFIKKKLLFSKCRKFLLSIIWKSKFNFSLNCRFISASTFALACYTIHFLHQEAQYDVKVFFNVFNNCFVKLLSILTRKSSIQANAARVYFGSWHDKNTDACRWHSARQWRQTKGLIPPTPLPGGSCKLSHEVRNGQWV